jgi:hypothetical protein
VIYLKELPWNNCVIEMKNFSSLAICNGLRRDRGDTMQTKKGAAVVRGSLERRSPQQSRNPGNKVRHS